MGLGWKRCHLLLFLIFWRHVFGHEVWRSQHVQPRSWRVHKTLSPRGVQSSMMEAPASGSLPPEEVDSVFAERSLNPSRSRMSYSQFVKGGISSSYGSMSMPQSATSGSVSASGTLTQSLPAPASVATLLQQGSRGSSVQDVAIQSPSGSGSYSQYDSTSKYRSELPSGGSGSLVSIQGGSGLSQGSFSQSVPGSLALSFSPVALSPSPSDQSFNTESSLSSSGPQTSNLLYSQESGSSQFLGASGQFAPGSTKLMSSPGRLSSRVTSQQAFQGGSSQFVSTQREGTSFSGLSSQFQSTSRQTPVSPAYASPGSSPFQSNPSQAATGSLHYAGMSVASPQVTSGQYNTAPERAYSVPQSQPLKRLQPSVSQLSQGLQSSSPMVPSSSPLQGALTKFVSPPSVSGPSWLASTQGGGVSGSYSGLSLSQSSPSQYTPLSPVSKFGSSPSGVSSQFTSSLGSPSMYASSSQSRTGPPLAAASQLALTQRGSGFNVGSSLQPQSTSSQYVPAPSLNTKLPVSSQYSQATPSRSTMSQSQLSQRWQPSASRWAGGSVPASSPAVSQSSSFLQSAQTPSRFLPSVGGPSQAVSTQGGSGSYSGLPQSLTTSRQYTFGSPAYAKFGSSPLGLSSQSASGLSSSTQYTSSSQRVTGSQLPSSSGLLSGLGSSSPSSSLLSQGTFGKYSPASSLDPSMPVYSQTEAVSGGSSLSQRPQKWQTSASSWSQGAQASSTAASQSSSQTPSSGSALSAFSFPVDSVAQTGQASVSRGQGTRFSGLGLRPSKLSALAASGSTSSQLLPGPSASLQQPTGSMGLSSGMDSYAGSEGMVSGPSKDLTALGESVPVQQFSSNYDASGQGMSSSQGMSGGSSMSSGFTSEFSSSYGSSYSQKDLAIRPSRGSISSRYSSVKG